MPTDSGTLSGGSTGGGTKALALVVEVFSKNHSLFKVFILCQTLDLGSSNLSYIHATLM